MTELDAFRIYQGTRIAILHGYDFVNGQGRTRGYKEALPARRDFPLIHSIMDKTDTPQKLLRLCVGNFLYGNDDFLYEDGYTMMNYNRHMEYMKNPITRLKADLDLLEIRCYNSCLEYLRSSKVHDDLYSCVIRMESFVLITQLYPNFYLSGNYLSEGINMRIKNSQQFIPLKDNTKSEILSREFLVH